MCCLSYENDYYSDAAKNVPKIGSEVITPEGKGTVVNINMLKMQVRVKIEDKKKDLITYHDYPVEQLKFKKTAKTEREDVEDDVGGELKEILD